MHNIFSLYFFSLICFGATMTDFFWAVVVRCRIFLRSTVDLSMTSFLKIFFLFGFGEFDLDLSDDSDHIDFDGIDASLSTDVNLLCFSWGDGVTGGTISSILISFCSIFSVSFDSWQKALTRSALIINGNERYFRELVFYRRGFFSGRSTSAFTGLLSCLLWCAYPLYRWRVCTCKWKSVPRFIA